MNVTYVTKEETQEPILNCKDINKVNNVENNENTRVIQKNTVWKKI